MKTPILDSAMNDMLRSHAIQKTHKPTVSSIVYATKEKSPYFFSRDTLKFFGQTVSMFRVWRGKSGSFYIAAPSYWADRYTGKPKLMGITLRRFTGDDLENVEHPDFHGSMEYAKEWIKQNG